MSFTSSDEEGESKIPEWARYILPNVSLDDFIRYFTTKFTWQKWRDIIFSYSAGTTFAFAWILWIDAQITSARYQWDPEATWWHWIPGLISTFGLFLIILVSWIHPEGDFLFTPAPEAMDYMGGKSEDSEDSDDDGYAYSAWWWLIIARVLMIVMLLSFVILLIAIGAAAWAAIQWFFLQGLNEDSEAFYPGIALITQTVCICCSAICFRVGVSIWVPVGDIESREDWYM